MQRYDSYKPSDVEWIGEIPSHWEYGRIKYLLSRSSAGVWGDDALENEDDIICYRVADFDYNHGILNQDNITLRNIQRKQLVGRLVSKGDLLVEKSGGGDTTPVGRVVRVNFSDKATCSNFIHSLSVNIKNNSSFLYYYFHQLYSNRINLLFFNQTTGIQNLQIDCYLSQGLYLPPLEEQERIAEYLDRRCAEIDGIINKEEQAIALLDELKQTIISEAVTRGLDPTVPLKPSGVDWIGNIPSHWEMVKVKHKYSFVTGFTPPSKKYEYYDNDNGYTWVCISDLNSKKVSSSASKVSKLAVSEFKPSLVVKGSLLFSFKLSIGQVAFAEDDLYTNEAIASFGNEERISLSFLYYSAPYYIVENAETNIYGAKLLNQELIKNAHIIFPPLEEQERIAEYLDRRCAEIDEAKERKQRQIELLREMKQTLISDAVTGRVKVF